MKIITVIVLAASLSTGCVATNVRELEAEGSKQTLSAPGNWQENYRTLHARMLECYALYGLGGTNPGQVHGQLYDELKFGEIIATYQRGPFSAGAGPYAQLKVMPAGSGTVVEMTTTGLLGKNIARMAQSWLDGSSTACRP